MNIVFYHDCPTAPFFQRKGLARVFEKLGHTIFFWNEQLKPAFDFFQEVKVDLFFGQTYNLSKALLKNLIKSDCRVLLYCSARGEILKDLDLNKYPLVTASIEEIKNVDYLVQNKANKILGWIHHHPNTAHLTIGHWQNSGLDTFGSCKAADVYMYYNGEVKLEYISDISFIGGSWGYKGKMLEKWIYPLTRFNLKIWGNAAWPLPQYLGPVADEESKHVFKSAKICPAVSEQHSYDFGLDPLERIYKIYSSGGFGLELGYVETVHKDSFPDGEIPYVPDSENLIDKIEYFLKTPTTVIQHILSAQKTIFKQHTYHHRVVDILERLDMKKEAEQTMKLYESWKTANGIT